MTKVSNFFGKLFFRHKNNIILDRSIKTIDVNQYNVGNIKININNLNIDEIQLNYISFINCMFYLYIINRI